jgi:hypothetical protein
MPLLKENKELNKFKAKNDENILVNFHLYYAKQKFASCLEKIEKYAEDLTKFNVHDPNVGTY